MANIHGLGDYNKKSGGGGAGRGGGGSGGGLPMGLGGPGASQQSAESRNIKHLQDGQLRSELQKAGRKLVRNRSTIFNSIAV